jgi:4,5-DOPA dioxygenase extradiol
MGGMDTLPPLFISHGSPMTALEPREAGRFMQVLGPTIDATFGRPRAVLAVSAHSLAREPVLLAAPRHEAVYDFGGFDPALYTLRYDAPGAPELARRVAGLLQAAGLSVHTVAEGGLDHGIWTPLRYLWPEANVPVLPLAWPPGWGPQRLFALGHALASLTREGVLIMASGSITHNLQRVFAGGLRSDIDRLATPESTAFRDWFAGRGAHADWPALLDYRRQAPHAALMHPTDEHLLPFFVAAGAAGPLPARRIHQSLTYGDLGMDAYAFGHEAERIVQARTATGQQVA